MTHQYDGATKREIDADGFAVIADILNAAELADLQHALAASSHAGRRGMLADPAVVNLALSPKLVDLVRPHLPRIPRPVRAFAFDKSPDANWLVPWHQDLTIAVRERRDAPGFGPWSEKEGVPHVQPPVELLEHMIAVRLHLDPADESNGALRLLAGTHRRGRLTPQQIQQAARGHAEVLCSAAAGDLLLMRPLVLHASRRATAPSRRRVLHIEYAGCDLPHDLRWTAHG